ncbi:hypothetical protein [Bacillus sp. 1P06AnD]|uniref:hypothetical protein n=1 Tax=Bacillus sp. 1P06AnD TaxID=3132208 RepID=UPI0039A17484
MYRKNCHKCNRPSFGSCQTGEWICPVCGEDLTALTSVDAELFDRSSRRESLQKWISVYQLSKKQRVL